ATLHFLEVTVQRFVAEPAYTRRRRPAAERLDTIGAECCFDLAIGWDAFDLKDDEGVRVPFDFPDAVVPSVVVHARCRRVDLDRAAAGDLADLREREELAGGA